MRLTVPASEVFLKELEQREYEELQMLRRKVKVLEESNRQLMKQLNMCMEMHSAGYKGKVN